MYDMYPWDSASHGDYPPRPLRSWRNPSRRQRGKTPPEAVQAALDRRDNGGAAQPVKEPAPRQVRQ